MSLDRFDMSDDVVLVTGSTRGIGAALAEGLAGAGATVVIHGRDPGIAAETAASLADRLGTEVDSIAFDVTDPGAIESGVQSLLLRHGRITGLVNNAGIQLRKPLLDVSPSDWDIVLRTNVTSAFLVGRAVARSMIDAEHGAIVNIGSIQSELARPSIGAYTASKGAIRNLTRAMTAEWAPHGLRINAIAPGYLATDMTQALVDDKEFSAWVERRTPSGRWGTPADLVGAAVFLLSSASEFVTGQIIYVDGGMSVVV